MITKVIVFFYELWAKIESYFKNIFSLTLVIRLWEKICHLFKCIHSGSPLCPIFNTIDKLAIQGMVICFDDSSLSPKIHIKSILINSRLWTAWQYRHPKSPCTGIPRHECCVISRCSNFSQPYISICVKMSEDPSHSIAQEYINTKISFTPYTHH